MIIQLLRRECVEWGCALAVSRLACQGREVKSWGAGSMVKGQIARLERSHVVKLSDTGFVFFGSTDENMSLDIKLVKLDLI